MSLLSAAYSHRVARSNPQRKDLDPFCRPHSITTMLQKKGNPISNAGIKTGTVDDYRRLTDESAVTITTSNDRISERLSNEFHKWHGMSVLAEIGRAHV